MTLTKQELKKMFLRVLYECLHGSTQIKSHGIKSIIPHWINEQYNIALSTEEIQLTHEAVEELKYSGILVRDASQRSDDFWVFTEKGLNLVKNLSDPDIYGIRLGEVISDQLLLQKCRNPFYDENYEGAIFEAFKHVEERVRETSGLSASDLGVNLMTDSLHPQKGVLVITKCQLTQEQEGVYNLFKGAIQFFKNPSSHRTVDYEKRMEAIKIIAFADLLLEILSSAKPK